MNNISYYHALAERIFFRGLQSGELKGICRFKERKGQKDLERAVRVGGLDGFGSLPSMGVRIAEVLEINPEEYDKKYGKPD